MSEKDYIISRWSRYFADMPERKPAIYGIGKNTKIILDNFNSDNIVGLMDEARTGESIYGKPIIGADEALSLGVDTIVIVARSGNTKIIYRRIADFCDANSIEVYSISGSKVGFDGCAEKSFEKYEGITEKILKEKIAAVEVVSFDIFDTLLMRRVLYPRDIFALMDKTIPNDFSGRRVKAETELYREDRQPDIHDIYERIEGVSPDPETELEAQYLIRRESMTSMLQYALEAGKEIYLVSDMYLPGGIIKKLLSGLGVDIEAENILVSCDCGVSKSSGLFDVLRAKCGRKRILHIGDNFEADTESARRCGIDDTFRIESAVTMLEDSYASEILKYDTSLPNRMLIAEFASKALNNPFLFGETNGKFLLSGAYQMAYLLIAPLIHCFFGWLTAKSRELQLERILLASRDGFIIERVYEIYKSRGADLPVMEYFYCSRTAAVLAGIMDDGDILHAARLAYAGKTEDMLKQRFNLSDGEILPRGDMDDERYILLHRDVISRRAEAARRQYKTYIDMFGIPARASVGFFDFVSSGTCQKALQNFVDFDLTGLYFAAVGNETEYKRDTKIHPLFGSLNVFEKTYNIMENYVFLENIITSYEPTLSGFDDGGNPVFIPERRTEKQFSALREIHAAILDYVRNSKIELDDLNKIDLAVPDFLLKLLHSQFSRTDTDYFDNEKLADEFCAREFSLSDTIR
jgi:FMN phosphatase YigB (HAD superfamily)